LSCDQQRGKKPGPAASAKPSEGGKSEGEGEQEEKDAGCCAEWPQADLGVGIEFPRLIEWSAGPGQGAGGEQGHAGSEGEKDSHCGQAAGWIGGRAG
jgi:hypothetical protein